MRQKLDRIVLILGVLVLAAAAPAWSICDVARLIDTGGEYLLTPGLCDGGPPCVRSISPNFAGDFWILGEGDPAIGVGVDSGGFPALQDDPAQMYGSGWLRLDLGYATSLETTWAADVRIDDCPDDVGNGCMALLLRDWTPAVPSEGGAPGTSYFRLTTQASNALFNYEFRSADAEQRLVEMPRASVVSIVEAGPGFDVTVATPVVPAEAIELDPDCPFATEMIVGYRVWERRLPVGSAPLSRDPAHGWAIPPGGESPDGSALPLGTDATLQLPCAAVELDAWLAVEFEFESGFRSFLGASSDPIRLGPDVQQAVCGSVCPDGDSDADGVCDSEDCRPFNQDVYPFAPQLCDGVATDCADPRFPLLPFDEIDMDGDGLLACAGDCDGENAAVYPGAPQICDGFNNDCDAPEYPWVPLDELDDDGDGIRICDGDCDDSDPFVYPLAPQLCDGVNNDCADPLYPTPPVDEVDQDGDLFFACGDCDDQNADVFPGAPEVCDGVNNDCDSPDYPSAAAEFEDRDGDGLATCEGDCNDLLATVFPGAPQLCDGVNNDCDDPGYPIRPADELDADGDGALICAGDCDDGNDNVGPGFAQICDGVNNDCSDPIYPIVPPDEFDQDGDGSPACLDCQDDDPLVFPFAPEICDGQRNDCNAVDYPGLGGTNEFDDDGDGVSECEGDCDDDNALCALDCLDADGDGACMAFDCDDEDPDASFEDLDGDGISGCGGDCDDTNPLCRDDCSDVDGDGVCADFDCDDLNPSIAIDVDSDGDGLSSCGGDCADDNPTCGLDCTDEDRDGVCAEFDCNDQNAEVDLSGFDDVDDDGDGIARCDLDCNDFNPYCLSDCTDVDGDGYCVDFDCDDGDAARVVDCPGVPMRITNLWANPDRTLSWAGLPFAEQYELAAIAPGFCQVFRGPVTTGEVLLAAPDQDFVVFLVRVRQPYLGTWGYDSGGAERAVPCD